MIHAVSGGCAVGIGLLAACMALLLPVTIWPGYLLGLLRLSPVTVARIERAVATTSVAVILGGTAGLLLLALWC